MRRLFVLLVLLASLGVTSGVAYGYFSSAGSGSSAARVSTATFQSLTISASAATPSTALLPGSAGDVTFKVNNPNAVAMRLVSATASGSLAVSGGTGCSAANAGVSFVNQVGLSITIPASVTNYTVDLPGAASMATSSSSGCQNASFSFPISITAQVP